MSFCDACDTCSSCLRTGCKPIRKAATTTLEQRETLTTLLPLMKSAARLKPTQNEWARLHNLANALESFLNCEPSTTTAAEWMVIAEREAKGATARLALHEEIPSEKCNGCPWDDRCEQCPARTIETL